MTVPTQRTHQRLRRQPGRAHRGSRFLNGRGQYVDDLTRDGLLHAVILRSQVAHGRIRTIDAAAARARPGVVAVITAADIGAVPTIPLRQEPLPACGTMSSRSSRRKVRYVGEPIAVVVAESAALAEDALEAILVDIEPLPAVADRAAARKGDVLLFEESGTNIAEHHHGRARRRRGGVRAAPYVAANISSVQRHSAVPMEPRGLLAEWDAAKAAMIVSGAAKVPFPNRRMLAKMMGLPEPSVRMLEYDVGGGFGARGEFYPEDFLIPFAARLSDARSNGSRIGARICWRPTTRATPNANWRSPAARDGTILGLRGRACTDLGAYLRTVGATASRNIAQVMSGPYRIPQCAHGSVVADDQQDAVRHLSRAGPVRGRFLPRAALRHGGGRARHRSCRIPPAQSDPGSRDALSARHRAVLDIETECDSGDYQLTLDRCLAEFGWAERPSCRAR